LGGLLGWRGRDLLRQHRECGSNLWSPLRRSLQGDVPQSQGGERRPVI
jgi:hypothetical protein